MICAGFLSKFGAGLFLLVQVIILLEFVHSWNDAWVEKDEQKWCAKKLLCDLIFHEELLFVIEISIYLRI